MKNSGNKIKDYVIPMLLQFFALVLFMTMHRLSVGRGALLLERVQVGDEMSSPTLGRMLYMLFAFVMFFVTAYFANKISKTDSRKCTFASFGLGIASGTFLWQALGEDSWHFGFQTENGLANMSQLESIPVVFILVVFLIFLAYVVKQNTLSFGVGVTVCSFLCNWLGHYVSTATYTFVQAALEEKIWFMISGGVVGAILLIGSLLYLFKNASTTKKRLICSTFSYLGVCMISMSILES